MKIYLNYRNDFNLMKDLAVHTEVGPTQRIVKYNNFIQRLTTTKKVNIFF